MNSGSGTNRSNNREFSRQQQNHRNNQDLMDVNDLPLKNISFDSKQSEDIDSDVAFAFELQAQEYAKNNISSSHHHYSTSAFVDIDHQRMINDRILAARLQEEENLKQYDQSTDNDAILAARLQQEENRKTHQTNNRTFQSNQMEHLSVSPFTSRISSNFPSSIATFQNSSQGFTNRVVDNMEDFHAEHNQNSRQSDVSRQRKALTKDEINILPTEKFHRTTNKNTEENTCGVCWEEFQQNEILRRLRCLHLYHKECIDPWLQRNNLCPICREPSIK